MKKRYVVLITIAIIALVGYIQRGPLAIRIMEVGAARLMNLDATSDYSDGLHIALCGAGSPLPDPKRSGSCVAVVAGKQLFIVDAGTNGVRNLNTMRYPVGKIKGVFLTHFHSDHIDGLGELAMMRWVNGANTKPLPVRGPSGIKQVVAGFNNAYQQDSIYRNDHHGDGVAPLSGRGMRAKGFALPDDGELVRVFSGGGLTVDMLAVDHAPVAPAVAYLFSYKGRTALISGDTDKSANIEHFALEVDLLVHEALSRELVGVMNRAAVKAGNTGIAKITADIMDYHASPIEAAETARDAGVGHLLYYHVVPPLILPGTETVWLDGVEEVFADYTLGEDGTVISLPANSTDIVVLQQGL
ncbi:MAG: MBL fold metallo-hydrolase [Halieaceae bacterium]|jgi:ribonuclease Z|nr:MBL fold metallo-hydrolase [Halieaceae bacterium]